MQVSHICGLTQKDKITAVMKRLELWVTSLKSNNFYMFPKATCGPADEVEESKVIISLWKQFSFYFQDPDIS